jgi:peptidoglycan/LPS O-acetylase OafA/YrhL
MFWSEIAAIQLLLSLENFSVLQKPFSTSFALYLGDISFSLYIVHFVMFLTVGRNATVFLINWTGNYGWGFCLGGVVLSPLLVWIADLQWRAFDEGSVRFARWIAVDVFA